MFRNKLTFRNLCIASAIVVILKIVYIVFFHKEFWAVEDFTIATNIVKYHEYSQFIKQGPTAYKLPVYPFCISFFLELFGDSGLMALSVFQAVLSFFSPLLIYKISELFEKKVVGILAGFLFILSPSYFIYPTIIEATNIFVPLLLLWFFCYFSIWFLKKEKTVHYVSLGLLTGVLFLTQVVIVPLAMIMLLALLFFRKVTWRKFSVLMIVLCLIYSPWVVRNYFVFDQLVLSKTPAWQNVYVGFTANNQLFDDLKLISVERDNFLYGMSDEVSELEMEKVYKNEVAKETQWEPIFFIKKAISNFICLWYVPPKYFYDNSISVLLGRKIPVLILNVLTIPSLLLIFRRNKMVFWFSILFFGNFTMPYLIGHAANIRFKLDFEWYQLILVAIIMIEIYNRLTKKRILERCASRII